LANICCKKCFRGTRSDRLLEPDCRVTSGNDFYKVANLVAKYAIVQSSFQGDKG